MCQRLSAHKLGQHEVLNPAKPSDQLEQGLHRELRELPDIAGCLLNRAPPNGWRLSCGAELEYSQCNSTADDGHRQLQARVRRRALGPDSFRTASSLFGAKIGRASCRERV